MLTRLTPAKERHALYGNHLAEILGTVGQEAGSVLKIYDKGLNKSPDMDFL